MSMNLFDKYASALPEGLSLEELTSLQPSHMWQGAPLVALANALALSGKFDSRDYLDRYPDVAAEGMDPIQHFLRYGAFEGRKFFIPPRAGLSQLQIPLISVLVPVFNNTPFLHECIESILAQTFQQIEVILLNDGSTDPQAGAILEEYAAKDARVRLINKPNTGYGHTMNVGLDAAVGKYVGIVEADDYVDPKFYQVMYDIAERYNTDITKTNFTTFIGNGETRVHVCRSLALPEQTGRLLTQNEDPLKIYPSGFVGTVCALYLRAFLQDNNIMWNETPGASYQDTAFWFKTQVMVRRQYYHSACLYHCRRDNEASSVHDGKKLLPVCYEHQTIRKLIYSSQLWRKFGSLYQRHFYNSYLWNMERADESSRQLFEPRQRADFLELRMAGLLNNDIFSPRELDYIEKAIASGPIRSACIYIRCLAGGGLERAAAELSKALKAQNYAVFFLLVEPDKIDYEFYGAVLKADMKNPQVLAVLEKSDLIFDYKYKFNGETDNLLKYMLERYSYKFVATIHNTFPKTRNYFQLTNDYLQGKVEKLKSVICVSQAVCDDFINLFGDHANVQVIHNGVNLMAIDRANMLAKGLVRTPYILFAGRVDALEIKGLDILIPAFLNSQVSADFDLVIAGGGTLPTELMDSIKAHPHGSRIKILGFQELFASGLMKHAHFLVRPSRLEGFSMILLEALACGTPVLTTSAGGAHEVVTEGLNGSFIKELSISELAADMERMASLAPTLRAACRPSVAWLDSRKVGKKFLKLGEPPAKSGWKDIKLSVIIPFYNSAQWLEECLRSVASQTLKEMEIICVDDGSTDGGELIAQRFPDPRIKYVRQNHEGPGSARNLALDLAKGEFVAFMDSDDILPDRSSYAELYANARNTGLLISGGNVSRIDQNGIIYQNWTRENRFMHNMVVTYTEWQYDFGYTCYIYNRKFLIKNSLYFPSYLRFEDPIFFVKAMYLARRFCVSPVIAYTHRIKRDNSKWQWSVRMAADQMYACADNLHFAERHNLSRLYRYTVQHANMFFEYIDRIKSENEVRVAIQHYNQTLRTDFLGKELINRFSGIVG